MNVFLLSLNLACAAVDGPEHPFFLALNMFVAGGLSVCVAVEWVPFAKIWR